MRKGTRIPRILGKSAILAVSLLLLLVAGVVGTVAYFSMGTETIQNTFIPTKVTTEVTCSEGGAVTVKNTGDIDAWIRVAVTVTWQQDGRENFIYGQAPNYSISKSDSWILGNDGFYYYNKAVAPNQVIEGLTVDTSTAGEAPATGYSLTVSVAASGLQSKPVSVFNDVWEASGITAAGDALTKN